jgi:hypothetical protein
MGENHPTGDSFQGMEWTVHPVRERTSAALGAGVVILLLCGAVWDFTDSLYWALFAIVVLLLQLNRFFLPSHFRIDGEGCTAEYPFRVSEKCRWSEVVRFYTGRHGGFLMTGEIRGLFGPRRRGVHILFGRQKKRVVEEIGKAPMKWGRS